MVTLKGDQQLPAAPQDPAARSWVNEKSVLCTEPCGNRRLKGLGACTFIQQHCINALCLPINATVSAQTAALVVVCCNWRTQKLNLKPEHCS